MPESIRTVLTSNYCTNHGTDEEGNLIRVQMMDLSKFGGTEVCPTCEIEKENEVYARKVGNRVKTLEMNKRKNTLHYKSVFADETIRDAGFKNYETKTTEEKEKKSDAFKAVKHYESGKTFTLLFQGDTGVGKSHLAMAVLRNLNETIQDVECTFINVRKMLMMIKDSFNDNESPYTQMYFIDLLSRVDYLVLDDLGNETPDTKPKFINKELESDNRPTATKFVLEVLTEALEARQNKSTIVTTNSTRNELEKKYSKALISRLLKGAAVIKFMDTTDKRVKPFDLNQEI